MALRPGLAAGLPLSICFVDLFREAPSRPNGPQSAPQKNLYVAKRPQSKIPSQKSPVK